MLNNYNFGANIDYENNSFGKERDSLMERREGRFTREARGVKERKSREMEKVQ